MAAETHATAHTPATDGPGVPHPYHLVNPSPWPILGAFAGGLLATGLLMFMHGSGPVVMVLGFAAIIGVMFGWWRDVLKESMEEKAHSAVVKIGLRYGMALFIASEVMFFAAFFWAYFDAALFPKAATGGVWPPNGIETVPPFGLPFMLTLILLLSGTTVTAAHHAILEGDNKQAGLQLALTVGLGVLFTGFQIYEYTHVHFGFTDGIYASTFFMATGFHGFHVFIGTVFLAVCWYRASRGDFTPKSHFGFEAAAWYWHFVDVVWLFLFIAVYWWGSGAVTH